MRLATSLPTRRSAPRWTKCEDASTAGCEPRPIRFYMDRSNRRQAQRRTTPTVFRPRRHQEPYETSRSLVWIRSVDVLSRRCKPAGEAILELSGRAETARLHTGGERRARKNDLYLRHGRHGAGRLDARRLLLAGEEYLREHRPRADSGRRKLQGRREDQLLRHRHEPHTGIAQDPRSVSEYGCAARRHARSGRARRRAPARSGSGGDVV